MKKLVKINNDQSVELNGSLGWLYVYREQFGRDILPDIMPIIESGLSTAVKIMQSAEGQEILTQAEFVGALDDQVLSDIFINLSGLELTTVLNIVWAMVKNANDQVSSPELYFNQFDRLPLDKILPTIIRMIIDSSISSKNVKSLLAALKRANLSRLTKSQLQVSTEG